MAECPAPSAMISRRPTNRNLQIFTAPTKAKSRDAFAFSRLISPRGESHADHASPLVPLTSLIHSFIHSRIYIAPLQENYSEVLPTPARSKRTVFNLL